ILYQCKFFDEALNVDALIFTKVDVNEKGGNIISSSYTLKKPILFLCTGQNYENLEKYDPNKVLNAILS
ncbi:MAG: signal recognition particle-docking protein FtsY, partial [Candidatus Aenigmatarchaeota archaeon]